MASKIPVSTYLEPGLHSLLQAQISAERRSASAILELALQAYLISDEASSRRDQAEMREKAIASFGPDLLEARD